MLNNTTQIYFVIYSNVSLLIIRSSFSKTKFFSLSLNLIQNIKKFKLLLFGGRGQDDEHIIGLL